jgi:hypothetical protein
MLLDDDVVTNREPKPGALAGRFRRKKWIKHLIFHVSRNTAAIVANPNLNVVAEVLGRGSENGFLTTPFLLRFALRRRVKAIRNQIQKRPRNLPWKQPAAGSNDRSSLIVKPRCSARAL